MLERLDNPGLRALAEVAGIEAPKSVYHATFVLGPRLNAGGRIGDPWTAAKLLATDDRAEAILLAEKLNYQNAERKEIEAEIQKAATGPGRSASRSKARRRHHRRRAAKAGIPASSASSPGG